VSRLILRLLGILLLAAGLVLFARDLWFWGGAGPFAMATMGELWYALSPGTLNLTQAVIQRYLWPDLWDRGVLVVLLWPAALVLGLPGLAILLLTGRR